MHAAFHRSIIAAGLAATLLAGGAARAGSAFTDGDLYLHTHAYPDIGRAIVRIDPVTGDKDVVVDLPGGTSEKFSFDPWRDRLIVNLTPNTADLDLVDAAGTLTTLVHGWPRTPTVLFAPTGDGRIYLVANTGGQNFGYVDRNGTAHDLLDVDGVTPFTLFFGFTNREDLIYDATTNSLFLVHFGAATVVHKIPLAPGGGQVAAAPETVEYDAFPPQSDEPLGLSAGPGGTLFIKIDTNSNADGLRMFTVDPATLQFAPFAVLSGTGVAGNTTGTYDSVTSLGVALDTFNDVLRTYVPSATPQEGTILATEVSSTGGSGEVARLISIGDTVNGIAATVPCQADLTGPMGVPDGVVDAVDFLLLIAQWGSPCVGTCEADVTGPMPLVPDGNVDALDFLLLVGQWGTPNCTVLP